ncbi:unnamed protein product [Brassica oleracea]
MSSQTQKKLTRDMEIKGISSQTCFFFISPIRFVFNQRGGRDSNSWVWRGLCGSQACFFFVSPITVVSDQVEDRDSNSWVITLIVIADSLISLFFFFCFPD